MNRLLKRGELVRDLEEKTYSVAGLQLDDVKNYVKKSLSIGLA